ncbi:MAG: ABC transporter permease [Janthinobacterium lividum]
MDRILLRRLAMLPPLLLAVSLLIFAAVHAMPGDPARLMAGPQATTPAVDAMRARLGLDQPLPVQYFAFLAHALHGDFGISLASKLPVTREIADHLPPTLALATISELLAIALGIPLGMLAGIGRGGLFDRTVVFLSAIGASVANFWLALMLMELFAVRLRWLPLLGAGDWTHYVLPAIVLAVLPAALILRMTRAGMIEVLAQDYIRTAHAKGLSRTAVYLRHALRSVLSPIVTVVALNLGSLIGGAVITETVFDWPGLGRLLVDAVRMRDYPIIQAMTLLAVLAVVLANLVGELAILLLNPQLREA